ncbi:uncharacterized protein LOC143438759 [Arvicanthis niloticus]|uniref:uncharacterized protein LOC143438759 n=1 Tax=Arvicanthis niloticus TaxID=61156 RepID=UPI00403D25BE
MGSFCSRQDDIQVVPVRQEIPPQEETVKREDLAEPVKVEPKKKHYDTDASGGRHYPTSITGISPSANRELKEFSNGLSDNRQMKNTQGTETNPPEMEVDSKDHGCFSSILTKLRRRPTNSSRVKPERSPVDVKACGLGKDLNEEDRRKILGKEATLPLVSGEELTRALTHVQSRRRRFITAMLKLCGIRWSISFTSAVAPAPSAVTTVPSTVTGVENEAELHKEQMKASGRQGTSPLPEVPSRRHKYSMYSGMAVLGHSVDKNTAHTPK